MARDLEALHGFLAARLAMRFAWGRHANDCVGFILEAARAMTGRDLLPGVTWTTQRGAARVIRRYGGLEAAMDRHLRSIAPAAALRGDVGAIADPRFGISLVLVEGASVVGPGSRGLQRLPRSAMLRAWNIEGVAVV